jgi:carboxyl-terminal processing protease
MIYIRILDFEAGVSEDLFEALDSLLHKPNVRPRGVILDLKGNPGGLYEEAIGVCNLFLPPGRFVVGTAARSRWDVEKNYSSEDDITDGLPIAVLVDQGSASAAEITAGALRQLGRAVLIGDTTYGKGLVQGYSQFLDGSGIRLTISRYFLEGNLFLNRLDSTHSDTGSGLTPDFYLPSTDRSLFLSYLEGSLLLFKFAHVHQDEIIAGPPELKPPYHWVEQFALYAHQMGFKYVSQQTLDAQEMLTVAKAEQSSPELIRQAELLVEQSRQDDRNQIFANWSYIETRLRQMAFDRKYGSYRSFAEAIVNARPDIKLAAQILARGKT